MEIQKLIVYLILIVSLGSCNKDTIDSTSNNASISNRTNEFNEKRAEFSARKIANNFDSLSIVNPLRYSIDWESGYYTNFFGDTSVIFDLLNDPFRYTEWFRAQVVFSQASGYNIDIRTLLYIADSTFYQQQNFSPRIINFTGDVIEYNSAEYVQNIYTHDLGEIVEVWEDLALKAPKCYNFGDSLGESILNFLFGWIDDVFGSGKAGNPNNTGFGPGFGAGMWGAGNFGGLNGTPPGLGGSGGSGGSGTIPPCLTPGFWTNIDPQVKKNYINALSFSLDQLDIIACHDPNAPGYEDCEVAYGSILCASEIENCFDGTNLNYNHFMDCLSAVLVPLNGNGPIVNYCETFGQTFINNYNLNVDLFDLAVLSGGFGYECTSQTNLDEFLLECEDIIELVVESMEECGDLEFVGCIENDVVFNGICPESFAFTTIGNGYSCEVNTIFFKYDFMNNTPDRIINIGTLCIQTPKYDVYGQYIDAYEASELMADAWNEAQDIVAAAFAASNHSLSDATYRALFKDSLQLMMTSHFAGTFGNATLTLTFGPCQGAVPSKKPKYHFTC